MQKLIATATAAGLALALFSAPAIAADPPSYQVPGAIDAAGRKVLTFVSKDPPGQRCNNNLQVAAEVANTYRVPIQLLPTSLVPELPAPSAFYGYQMIAADKQALNGQVTFDAVSDLLEVEGAPKQPKAGLLYDAKVRGELDALKSAIKGGGK